MKKTLALLLALIMAFSMFSVVAFADNSATLNVALVDDEGNAVTGIKAGESVWAVISVANYANYVGEMEINWDADDLATGSAYDKVISVATTYLELDTDNFIVATDDDGLVWESPYKTDIADQGGSMEYNLDGNVLKTLLQTDYEGGVYYSIGKAELDANNGELYRVKLIAASDAAVGDYTVALNGGDGITAPGIATISSAAGEAEFTTADIPVALGAAANIEIYSDEIIVEEPDSYTIADATEGFVYDDWTAVSPVTPTTAEDADKGNYSFSGSNTSQRADVVYNKAFYFDGADVRVDGTVGYVRYNNNNLRQDAPATYGGVALGALEFRMEQHVIPQIWYNGEKIAQGDALIPTYYVIGEDGEFATDEEGNKIVATDAEGNPLYPGWATEHTGYIDSVKLGLVGHNAFAFTYTLEVKDGVVYGYITYKNASNAVVTTDALTVALPAGAFAEAVKPAVITAGTISWTSANFTNAMVTASKAIVDVAAEVIIAKAPFTTDDWTIVSGRGVTADPEAFGRDKTYIDPNGAFIQTMTYAGDIIVKHAKTFTGSDFTLEYTAKRESYMGNGQTGAERFGVRVGDFYFAMNSDGMLPYVEYAGTPVYQGETLIWDLLGADAANIEKVEAEPFADRFYHWSVHYEGANPTYKITLKDNKLKVTFTSANYAETVIVPEMDVNFGEFNNAQVSYGGNHGYNYSGHERLTSFYLDNAGGMKKVDLGLLNAQMNAFAARDYANVPDFVKTVVKIAGALTDADKVFLTEANIAKAKAFAEKAEAYATLGSVTISNVLATGFASENWVSINNTAVTTAEYGVMRYFKNGTFTATGDTYDLSNGFRAGLDIIKQSYNRDPNQHTDIIVGAIKVSLEANTIVIYNGDTVVATAASAITYNADNAAAAYATVAEASVGGMTGNTHAKIDVEYKDGVVTATVNGTVMATAAVEADLTAAQVKVVHYDNKWNRALLYNYYLYSGEVVVNLFELNEQMGELANIGNWKNYSEIAATADAVIPQITDADKLAAMYNIPVYEAYKEAYAIAKNGATYKLINGIYEEDWTHTSTAGTSDYWIRGSKEIVGASFEDGVEKPAVVATIPVDSKHDGKGIYFYNGNGTMNATTKLPLATAGYFKIDYKYGYYYRDSYIQWKVGDLAIRVSNNGDGEIADIEGYKGVYVDVYYAGEHIHRITGSANELNLPVAPDPTSGWMYANCPFTIIYDNGILHVTNYNGATKYITPTAGLDLTTIDGFDANYNPNGKNVELEMAIDYNQAALCSVAVTGRFNKDAIAALDELAATDAAAAKNIFDTISKTDSVTAATKALLSKAFEVSADETATYTYTVDGHNTDAYRYGDTITLTGAGAEGYIFAGWFDAEGNLLSDAETYTVKVEPGVTIVAKGEEAPCEHVWGDWIANEDGLTETRTCELCGETETQDIVVDECAHEWSEWEITTPATTTTPGIKTRTCGLCGATETMEYTVATSGASGDTTWRVENGTLYIEGTGAMANYVNVGDIPPWREFYREITAIVIGDEVTYIGNRAFKGLNKVTTATIGANVETTGYECFYGCTALTTVNMNDKLTYMGSLLFYNCAFESIEIPATVTRMEHRVFKFCKNLTAIEMPNAVTYGGYEMFMGCTSLVDVTLSNQLPKVNSLMFTDCTALTEIFIPAKTTRIGLQAFSGCTALETVEFENDDTLAPSGDGTEASIASNAFTGCSEALTIKGWMAGKANDYAVQKGINFVATNTSAFVYTLDANNNATITGMRGSTSKLEIPATVDGYTVVAIGNAAFRDNTKVTRVIIPATVTSIGGRAFQGCTALATVEGLENVTTIAYNAFANCSALTSVSFSAELKELAGATFQNCTALGEIYVPNTITKVNDTAFSGCTNAIIKTQADSAAAKAAAKAGLTVKIVTNFEYEINADGESVTVTGVIGNVTELVIPDEINGLKVTAIKQRAFKNNTTLTSVVIGNNVTLIKYEAFMNCTNITSITVGTGLATTESNTFGGMTGLETITFASEGISFHANTFLNSNANLTVNGVAGSTTQTFAENKGFTFVAL